MKKLIFILFALVSLSAAQAQNFPSVKVQDLKGNSFDTKDLINGKTPFIISFWSTTCKPCMKELDAISEALEDWLSEVDFRMVAVSIDDSRSLARAKAQSTGRGWEDFTLIFDPNQDFKRAMNVIFTPQVFVYDKNGNQVYAHTGYTPGNEAELLEVLKKLK
ncbi:TlpA family protein disulfide reductase [Bacteroides timonensis]|uniref:TlpA family protein disulfide reductase n=1 Tax=Bacteroides timonensis TaxID=1470345 RepID=UPI0005C5B725|nr:TlpA disulfide reductase family protein [Bacteroides timonensis]